MKTLAIFNTLYFPYSIGGAEKSVQLLAQALVEHSDYKVVILTLTDEQVASTEVLNGVEVHRIRLANLYWPYHGKQRSSLYRHIWHLLDIFNPLMAYRVYRQLKVIKPDLIHTNNLTGFSCAVWMVGMLMKVPIVHTARDYYLIARNLTLFRDGKHQSGDKWSSKLFSAPKKYMSKWVGAYVGISEAIGEIHLSRGFFPNAVYETIYNGVSLPDQVPEIRAGSPSRPLVLGFVGRLDEHKGIEKLLQAFEAVGDVLDLRLKVAGQSTHWFEQVSRTLRISGRVELLGWIAFSEFIEGVDVVVVPSVWEEPFGRVVIESYAYGRPVLAANRGGLPEIVKSYTGRIFDPESSTDFEGALSEIVSLFRDGAFDPVLINKYAREFSAFRHTSKYMRLYDSLL